MGNADTNCKDSNHSARILVAFHPFIDGNGRTARLVMNLILMRAGYPPGVIQKINHRQYYQVLDQADRDHPGPLVNLWVGPWNAA